MVKRRQSSSVQFGVPVGVRATSHVVLVSRRNHGKPGVSGVLKRVVSVRGLG